MTIFFLPSDTYHHSFARISAGLALSAARTDDHEAQGKCLVTFLRDLGFEEIDAHTYDTDPTADSVGLVLGYAAALAAFGLLNGLLAGTYSTGKAVVLILIYTLAFVIPLFLFQKPAAEPVAEVKAERGE